jgi:hypothetical protein
MEESARELDEGLDSQLFSSRTLHGTSKKIITMHVELVAPVAPVFDTW